MRMWCVDPKTMCRRHLLGEHLEVHMFINHIRRQDKDLKGFVRNGILDSRQLFSRHKELVEEMEARGYNHKTPAELTPGVYFAYPGNVDREVSLQVLLSRCAECKERSMKT